MPRALPKLAIVASDECRTSPPLGKRWFHLRRFVRAYAPLLTQYQILATDVTAGLIQEALEELPSDAVRATLRKQTIPLGETFPAVVHIASEVAKKQITRVLMFQDPRDLRLKRPERYALLRNCNLVGAALYINSAAHLWALYESERTGLSVPWRYVRNPVNLQGWKRETVALIAHDREKERLGRIVLKYRAVFSRFPRLIATSGTARYLRKLLDDASPPGEIVPPIETIGTTDKDSHGPAGGDVIIADEIFRFYREFRDADQRFQFYSFHHILFFADFKSTHAHEADIRVLFKTCVDPSHRVNLILNSRMAREWAERYTGSVPLAPRRISGQEISEAADVSA